MKIVSAGFVMLESQRAGCDRQTRVSLSTARLRHWAPSCQIWAHFTTWGRSFIFCEPNCKSSPEALLMVPRTLNFCTGNNFKATRVLSRRAIKILLRPSSTSLHIPVQLKKICVVSGSIYFKHRVCKEALLALIKGRHDNAIKSSAASMQRRDRMWTPARSK